MIFTGIDHPAIVCRDVRRQIEWYCANLGMQVIAKTTQDPLAAVVGYGPVSSGGAMIELAPARDAGPEPAQTPRAQPGLRHLALRVSDFDAAYAKLKALGVEFIGEPGTALGGGRIISFRDPEGNELQIVQRNV